VSLDEGLAAEPPALPRPDVAAAAAAAATAS